MMSRVCTMHDVTFETDGVCGRCAAVESVTAAAIASIRQHSIRAVASRLRVIAEHIARLELGRESMADIRRRAFVRGGYVARDRLRAAC